MPEPKSPLRVGYAVREGDMVIAMGLSLEEAARIRAASPYTRRIAWLGHAFATMPKSENL